jgi:hypothetical protein
MVGVRAAVGPKKGRRQVVDCLPVLLRIAVAGFVARDRMSARVPLGICGSQEALATRDE